MFGLKNEERPSRDEPEEITVENVLSALKRLESAGETKALSVAAWAETPGVM